MSQEYTAPHDWIKVAWGEQDTEMPGKEETFLRRKVISSAMIIRLWNNLPATTTSYSNTPICSKDAAIPEGLFIFSPGNFELGEKRKFQFRGELERLY